MKTIKALWRFMRGHYLGRKDLNLLEELAANTKVAFIMLIFLIAFFFLADMAGCYESRLYP